MLTYLISITEYLYNGYFSFFLIFFTFVVVVWLLKVDRAILYRPEAGAVSPDMRASVIIPVVDELPGDFRAVLRNIVHQTPGPEEILVIINGPRNQRLEEVAAEFVEVTTIHLPVAGKRPALKAGIERASGDVVVLVDSDTIWARNTLEELLKPFRDPLVGGVTTHQEILMAERSWVTRFAAWMEQVRCCISFPALSYLGQVGCLPGRTIAFRREILLPSLDQFLSHRFLGVHLDISDDRWFTNWTLKQGYRTVYQRTSRVVTNAPNKLGKFVRQQLRWARGSQYNTLEMLPWMLRNTRFLAVLFLSDILIPFLLVATVINWCLNAVEGKHELLVVNQTVLESTPVLLACVLISMTLGFVVRQWPYVKAHPREAVYLPLHVLIATFLLVPLRIWGFVTMCFQNSWGTRATGPQEQLSVGWRRQALKFVPSVLGGGLLWGLVYVARLVEGGWN